MILNPKTRGYLMMMNSETRRFPFSIEIFYRTTKLEIVKKYNYLIMLIIINIIIPKAAQSHSIINFRFASPLQNNMVIQQEKPCTIWGYGSPGLKVSVSTDWTSKQFNTTVNEVGKWEVVFSGTKAKRGDFTPHVIIAKMDGQEISLENVLIGDVWFFSGQSNMDMTVAPVLPWHNGLWNYEEEIANANFPNIRFFETKIRSSQSPLDEAEGDWNICSPGTVGNLSAIAYCMGQTLFKELNIPIGLIVSARGATSCQAFTSKEVLESKGDLKQKYLDTAQNQSLDVDPGTVPCIFYNAMIYPFRKLSIKGFCWDQGENNSNDGPIYAKLVAEMVIGWRNVFKQPDLPFYFVQVGPLDWGAMLTDANHGLFFSSDYAYFREIQANTLKLLPNSEMVSKMDVAVPTNPHAPRKRPIGERMAALALKYVYHQVYRVAYGPRFKSMKIDKNVAIISFEPGSIGSGLMTNNGKAPNHFFVAGEDRKFYLANAEIKGDRLFLSAPEVPVPTTVRYAFLTYPVTNFQNKEGFPADVFRTDDWTDATYYDNLGGNDKIVFKVRADGSGNYKTITSAIHDACKGDTIDALGVFNESLLFTFPVINNLVIKGHGPDKTIIQLPEDVLVIPKGNPTDHTIVVSGGINLTLIDLTIRKAKRLNDKWTGAVITLMNKDKKVTLKNCVLDENVKTQ
jgi:sialate O-acetylesterase